VLRTISLQPTLWEALLPQQCLGLPAQLVAVDALLDDPVFFEPYRAFFDPRMGRPSIPIESYLRLMFLKYRYRLGYETLCREVADSIAWRRFARVPLDVAVPHPTILMKITSRCGQTAVDGLNRALLSKADAAKVLRTNAVRADTTVIPANVSHPSDAGLLAQGVRRLVGLTKRIKAAGLAARTTTRDRRLSVARRTHAIGTWLRRRTEEAKDEVMAITAELVTIAEAALAEAKVVAANSRRGLRRTGTKANAKARRAVLELEATVATLETIVAQARVRVAGGMPDGATRVVSLHDTDARPMVKGRIGRPVEFGYKAAFVDNAEGVILDHEVMKGNPADAGMLVPAVSRIAALLGRVPKAVAADRGYGEAAVEAELTAIGVKTVVIPRKGRANAERREVEHRRGFVRLIKWRTGAEGRVSTLKRDYGWSRTLMDGEAGAATWCGWGVLAHNSVKISNLLADKEKRRRRSPSSTATAPQRQVS
jgi:IS5 family transposase